MSTQPERPTSGGMTRRGFLGGTAGLSIGAALPFGAAMVLQASAAGAATLASPAVVVALEIDGAFAGFVERVQGGEPTLQVDTSQFGSKVLVGRVNELELGFSPDAMNGRFFGWFGKSLTTSPGMRVRLALTYYDQATGGEIYRLSMTNARIVEVVAPRFDASSSARLRFTIRIDADKSAHDKLAGTTIPKPVTRTKGALESLFLMYIQGREMTGRVFTRVDGLALRLDPSGGSWAPRVVQAQLRPADAAPLYGWHGELIAGKVLPAQGVVQMLNQDFSKVLGTIDLVGMLPLRVASPPISNGTLDPVTVDFYCSSMSFSLEGFV